MLAPRCKQDLWRECLSTYLAELGGAVPWWLRERRSGVSLSHAATAYMLLHEQDVASSAMRGFEGLWRARTLEDVERTVFGCLPDLVIC